MAEGGGTGITTMPVLQSLSQARDKWGDHAAGAIWDASIVKVILGGTSSARDLQDLSALIGERDERTDTISVGDYGSRSLQRSIRRVPVMPPETIRTLPFGTGAGPAAQRPAAGHRPASLDLTTGCGASPPGSIRRRTRPSPTLAGQHSSSRLDGSAHLTPNSGRQQRRRASSGVKMSIPTQMSLAGFIATVPDLHFSKAGAPRFHARVGCEHFRKEVDGSFTKLDPTFHDLVIFNDTALTAYERFKKGDSFLASGYIHEYEVESNGTTVIRDEFIARRIGHDTQRTKYEVRRRQVAPAEAPVTAPAAARRRPVSEPVAEPRLAAVSDFGPADRDLPDGPINWLTLGPDEARSAFLDLNRWVNFVRVALRAAAHGDPAVLAPPRRADLGAVGAASALVERLPPGCAPVGARALASRLRRRAGPAAGVGGDQRHPARPRPADPGHGLARRSPCRRRRRGRDLRPRRGLPQLPAGGLPPAAAQPAADVHDRRHRHTSPQQHRRIGDTAVTRPTVRHPPIEGTPPMLLAHAVALAEARTYIAALADLAVSPDASLAYERTLLYLDSIHGDDVPALDTGGLIDDRTALYVVAESAVEELVDHGVDALQVELVLAMLDEARELDAPV